MQQVYNKPWHSHCRCNFACIAPSPSPLNSPSSLTYKVYSIFSPQTQKRRMQGGRQTWCDLPRKETLQMADAAFPFFFLLSHSSPHEAAFVAFFSLVVHLHISFLPFRSSPFFFIPLGTEKAYYGVRTAGLQLQCTCTYYLTIFLLTLPLGDPGLVR